MKFSCCIENRACYFLFYLLRSFRFYSAFESFWRVHGFQVSPYLRSRNWDTRVAAAHAIGAIAESVKHASLAELFSLMEEEMSASGLSDSAKDIATACSNFHPNVVAGLSFRRSNFDFHFSYLLSFLKRIIWLQLQLLFILDNLILYTMDSNPWHYMLQLGIIKKVLD